jgi:FkbM family methyltransferase
MQTPTAAGRIRDMNVRSWGARYWTAPGYRYRPVSIHDPRLHAFWADYPIAGWADVKVGDIELAMFTGNDDGVALIYHAFGPDAYEPVSVAAWAEMAAQAQQIADIGAFTGLFAMLAKKAAPEATVLAVEPNSANRARLHTNLVWNGLHNRVAVAALAVAEEIGALPLFVPMGADLLDTGSSLNRGSLVTRTELVMGAPVDVILEQYGVDAPDLIKIDVEGLEEAALRGASRALARRPTLILEVQAAETFERCRALLQAHGYALFALDDDEAAMTRIDPTTSAEAWFESHVRGRALNYLCVARQEHLAAAERGVKRIQALLGTPLRG